MIYLNSVEDEGATVFYDDTWAVRETIHPKEGMAVLFHIDLWHRAEPLVKHQKSWIGCELIGSF